MEILNSFSFQRMPTRFPSFVYVSQVLQALSIKVRDCLNLIILFNKIFAIAEMITFFMRACMCCHQAAVEHWRRCKPICMGTIYWQLNDIWQGNYHALHFYYYSSL